MKTQNGNTFSERIDQRQQLQVDFKPISQTLNKEIKWSKVQIQVKELNYIVTQATVSRFV